MKHHTANPGSRNLIFFWPIICLVAGAALWLFVDFRQAAEKSALETQALKDTASLSRAYAAYLGRSLEQMDQITMHVKSDWERWNRRLKLEDLKKDGLFTATAFLAVSVIDRDGRTVTSTAPIRNDENYADSAFFHFHHGNISTALRISKPDAGRAPSPSVIHFTRRLDTADDSFDGVVLVAVEPAYFLSFYDPAILGENGLLAVIGDDQVLRAATIGGNSSSDAGFNDLVALRDIGKPWRLSSAEKFADGEARFVAWQDLKTYPLTVMVGLSRQELLAPREQNWGTYRNVARGGTVFLIIVAVAGGIFGIRVTRQERQAQAVRKTYRLATDSANEGFYILDPLLDDAGDIVDWLLVDTNERGASFFGMPGERMVGKRLSDFYPGPLFQVMLDLFRIACAAGEYEDEYRVPRESPLNAQWLHRRLVKSETGVAMTIRDISQIKKNEQELLRLANEDALTGLPNRHWLAKFLPLAVQRASQNGDMLAVLFLDLDEFKNINDTLGHSAGDKLLKIAAQRVKSVLRPSDKIVRLGGDEFTVIVEQVSHRNAAAHVAERIAQALQAPLELGGSRQSIRASIGISVYPDDGLDPEILLKNADIAMYSVKESGKGHFRFFEPQLYATLKERLDIEQALRQAIELDRFVLHYQPRVDAVSGAICGMEALVRWIDPVRGLIPPLDFIPEAERTGLILPLGALVIDKACAQVAAWKQARLPVVPVSVNVSARQFNEGDIKSHLLECIARHGIQASDIQIELTESAMMGDQADVADQLAAIRSRGIKLMVDDFGTGYSSLSQLQRLDMDVLKVDRAFTAELGKAAEGQVFFKAIVSMAHALGMKVTAEGVEDMQQLAILRALGCDEVQGYFISRPLPAGEMSVMLQNYPGFPPAARLAELAS
ncbi:EAL domain-containing protein [Janthinobacterium sp. 17J80-10]|uniref:bifunctional diguanylate cyclase/phosphodiesterase n=1 Tax=Janthinobacterium sp. 17J80-10 TaxID=2497863 RepID=UPI00100538EB|nr:EAL domain-containing protein [Janthinobacterium sp. 17J80-10]QAU35455.1 EAL domain-containing protein [Janthinobacterium sp. 17J80-10]